MNTEPDWQQDFRKPRKECSIDVSKLPNKVLERICDSYSMEPGNFILNCNDLIALSKISRHTELVLRQKKKLFLFEQIFALIRKYTSKIVQLRCRLVCKRWKYSVDTYFENQLSLQACTKAPHQIFKRNHDSFCNSNSILFSYNIEEIDGIHKLLVSLPETSNWNFIIGRGVVIKFGHKVFLCPKKFQAFRDITMKLLSKVGKHLWYITFYISCPGIHCMDVYLALCSFLRYLPNIKSLKIFGRCANFVPKQNGDLNQILKLNPFPVMSSLQTIIIGMQGIDSRIDHAIVVNSKDTLRRMGLSLDSQKFYDFQVPLLNLVELNVFNVTDAQFIEDLLIELAKYSVQLKKFTTKMVHPVNLLEILEYLRAFNVVVVVIDAWDAADDCDYCEFKECPSIHILKFLLRPDMTLEFLSRLPNLAELHIGPSVQVLKVGPAGNPKKEMSRLCSELISSLKNVPPSSWLWTKLKNLKQLCVETYDNQLIVYSRAQD